MVSFFQVRPRLWFIFLLIQLTLTPVVQAQAINSGEALLAQVNKRISNIATLELEKQLSSHPETVMIDVRTPR